ncbi:MAG: right-handed parallel beta-helix repeat-containing protein [Sedimentisphaerales bacterium]
MNAGNLTLMDSGEPNIIEINSDITTNQIWTANNIYHINSLINVTALLVIEPGTVIYFAYQAGLTINNGGTLISRGTPDKPIIYTCDFMYPDYGYYFEYLEYYQWQYFYPAYIDTTASPATTITYSFVEGAMEGIVINNIILDHPIENNHLFGNAYGIVEFGPKLTDIKNNLCFYNYYDGIYVKMSDANEIGDANTVITIENNTCDSYQDVGIMVHGASNESGAGQVMLVNNIVSGSYMYGLNLVSGYMNAVVASTGYYGNANNKNWEFEEYNPVVTTVNPFDAPGWHLIAGCPFIDAGMEYIEETPLIGMTTNVNGMPDSNKIDIGYHYPNWNYSNAGSTTLQADFDGNFKVDYKDLCFFANYWLFDYNEAYQTWSWDYDNSGKVDMPDLRVVSEYWLSAFNFYDFADFANQWQKKVDERYFDSRADLNNDKIVNFKDFAILANEWRKKGDAEPNILPTISGDPNSGYVNVGVSGFASDTQQVFLLADGKYVGEIFAFSLQNGNTVALNISTSGSQERQLKLIGVNNSGHITCSKIKNVSFSCPLNYCILPETYEPNKPLYFAALNNGTGDVSVKAYANDGNLVWSQTYSGNNVFGSIPATITNQYEFDYVSFDKSGGISIMMVIDPVEPPLGDVQALIILPEFRFRLWDFRQIAQVQEALAANGITYKKLGGRFATYDNVAWYAANKNIKYIYIDGDGDYRLRKADGTSILRTGVQLYDGYVVSMKQSDFAPGGAPSWCQSLGNYWETMAKSFVTMGFNYLEFAQFDTCFSGHLKINANNQLVEGQPGQIGLFDIPYSDMSLALGMGNTSRSRFYQGWYLEFVSSPWLLSETDYQKWTRFEWEHLGDGYDLYWALQYVISKQTEFDDPRAPVNNYRVYGQGWLDDITLSRW